ncbi:MAG: sugar phosphate nucleotidyltransferase, partial [Candidatus Bathyarchaeia archaeon]
GDNITIPPCIKQIMQIHERYNATVLALEEVSKEKVRYHGVVGGVKIAERIIKVEKLIEKPELSEAPSNIAIIGRYILTPEVFEYLKSLKPGYQGEVQLTDALANMIRSGNHIIYGYLYEGRRYDIGDIGGWLKTNIELALKDEELKEEIVKLFQSVKEAH